MIGEVVCDASALVALLEADEVGEWLAEELHGVTLHAPELVMFEAANIIRRHELDHQVSPDRAALAFADLVALPIELCPFAPLAQRVWELRHNVTAYDASYVALAELGETALVTVDYRLARATGPLCQMITPPRS